LSLQTTRKENGGNSDFSSTYMHRGSDASRLLSYKSEPYCHIKGQNSEETLCNSDGNTSTNAVRTGDLDTCNSYLSANLSVRLAYPILK
jgi:hypothetical protein